MRITLSLMLFSILPALSYGNSLYYSDELTFTNCNAPSKEPVLYCQESKKSAWVQVLGNGQPTGFVLADTIEGTFTARSASEGGNAHFIYALSDKVNEDVPVPEFDTIATRKQDIDKHYKVLMHNIELAKKNDAGIVEDLVGLKNQLVDSARGTGSILPRTQEFMVVYPENPVLSVYTEEKERETCRFTPSSSCPLMECGDNHLVILDSERDVYIPISFTRDREGNAKFTKDDPETLTVGLVSGELIRYNEAYEHSRLTRYRKAPENLRKNVTAYFTFQDEKFSEYLKEIIPQCSLKSKNDIVSLGMQTNEERRRLNLVPLVVIINGKVHSHYVNEDFLLAGARPYDGSYYSQQSLDAVKAFRLDALKEVAQTEADSLFAKAKQMKNMSWDRASEQGAAARAELTMHMIEEEGAEAGKVWVSGLLVSERFNRAWNYHDAPFVHVKAGQGKIEKRVIDPLVAERPVTVGEWLGLMKASINWHISHVPDRYF